MDTDTDTDRPRINTANRFGQLSKSMFFARHVPQPKYLKFITGTAGVKVCHVRDDIPRLPLYPSGDLAKSLLSDPRFTIEFPPNSYNEALLRSYAEKLQPKQSRERFLPPIRNLNSSGTVEPWRHELSRIAEMVGLVTIDELSDIESKRDSRRSPLRRTPSRSGNGEYSQRTGRWNETPKTLSRSKSFSGRTPLSALVPNHLFCVDAQERELWMLQVLCQILKTQDINEVQSWLTASSSNEKDTVRQLIASAIKGLEESGRIQPTAYFIDSTKSIQLNPETNEPSTANIFSSASLSDFSSATNDYPTKPSFRPRTSPQIQSTTHDAHNKSNRSFQANLNSIDEEKYMKNDVPQPTKVDGKRDIQILTLNDDVHNNHQATQRGNNDIPF